MTFTRSLQLVVLVLVASIARRVPAAPERASNRVVLLIDASGSYRARQADAVERATQLLDDMSARKVHRWEPSTDEIVVISLDAMPEVLWRGTLAELKHADRARWSARFRARSDFASCTDVSAAFRLAAANLAGDSRHVHKFLFAFTDLIDEPPVRSLRRCRRAASPSRPAADFPWGELRDVTTHVLWTPPEQTLVWRRADVEHGLDATTFAVHTTSESATVTITPPPRAEVQRTEAEKAQDRARTIRKVAGIGRAAGVVVLGLFGLLVLAVVVGLIARARRRAGSGRGMRAPTRRPPPAPRPAAPLRPAAPRRSAPLPPARPAGRA